MSDEFDDNEDESFDEADLITCDGCGDSDYRLVTFNCSCCGRDICEICQEGGSECTDCYHNRMFEDDEEYDDEESGAFDDDGILEPDTH
jgi:hypothetical protein